MPQIVAIYAFFPSKLFEGNFSVNTIGHFPGLIVTKNENQFSLDPNRQGVPKKFLVEIK